MQVPTVGLKPKRKVEEGECSARLQDKRGRIPARCLARAPSRLPRVCRVDNFFDHWIGSEGPAGPVRARVRAPRWRANPDRLYFERAARRLGRLLRRTPGLRRGYGGRGAGHWAPIAGRTPRG